MNPTTRAWLFVLISAAILLGIGLFVHSWWGEAGAQGAAAVQNLLP